MKSFTKDLVFLTLQFLKNEKFEESMHKLEQESGFFFNMEYFGEKILAGEWEEVEKYLSGFTKVDDNRHSKKIFYEIRKHKYLEALDRQDTAKAAEILMKDLKVLSTTNEEQELFKETTMLLTLTDFREHKLLSDYNDTESARTTLLRVLKEPIASNPLFSDKLVFPTLETSRLRRLINQSLNWQHDQCKNPEPNPQIKTLFADHMCPDRAHSSKPVTCPVAPVPRPGPYTPLTHGPFPPNAAPNVNIAGWMANSSASCSVQPFSPNQVSIPKRPRNHSNIQGMLQNTGHKQQMKSLQSTAQPVHKVTHQEQLHFKASFVADLPGTLVCSFEHQSSVTSMDFHPSHQTLLLAGCGTGEVTLWEIGMREWLVSEPFKIWEMATCSTQFQSSIVHDPSISITRVAWSPDGNWMGVAFTKHLVHVYAYQVPNELRQHLEIDAHLGNVNDLAFCHPNKQLGIVTCGDDKIIKVWDLTGQKLFNFEGHKAPVFSVCPHLKENIQFVLSTDFDGKIKVWLYDNVGSRVDFDTPAPGHWCTAFLYSADGSRLFSCGTSKDGYSFLVEWNESEGAVKRTYSGLGKKSVGVVQFDTSKNGFLAAGEDNQIKIWDMNHINILATTDAGGGLPSLPRLRFNKDGNLLAVTTAENGFKILANTKGFRSLTEMDIRFFDAPRVPISHAGTKNDVDPTPRNVEKPKPLEDVSDKPKPLELAEVVDHVECQVVTLPEIADPASKVTGLLYTNSGAGILALGSNGIQKLWKWGLNEQNPTGKATASVIPQHWQPNSGLLMINDISDVNLEEAVPCIALSKNGAYVMSAAGGKVSLFNMLTFKAMTTFMPPPPASTFIVFHPKDNNIVAIGMDDSTTHIYNVRVDEVKTKLKGHQKRITGLAFSTYLNIMVSSGADAQLCTWSADTWAKKKSVTLQHPSGKMSNGDTRVQFHSDHICLLICHETQLAIYDACKMECIRQWVPQDGLPAPISFASYSCNSLLVYAAFRDGKIGVFDAETLRVRCHISPSAYITQAVPTSQPPAYPLVLATHPQEPNQLAVGLTDGSVKVIEPSESNGKWGMEVASSTTRADNGTPNGGATAASSSATSNNHS